MAAPGVDGIPEGNRLRLRESGFPGGAIGGKSVGSIWLLVGVVLICSSEPPRCFPRVSTNAGEPHSL